LFALGGAASASRTRLVDATRTVPDLAVDLRYATTDNFMKRAVYPEGAKCLVLSETAERLKRAAQLLRAKGYRLLAWDCYRPFAVQKQMWELYPHRGYVADPGRGGSHHNRGAAIDLTLVGRDGSEVEMPTPFDTFSRSAHLRFDGCSKAARAHRDMLVRAMEAAGFIPNPMEWWHFDIPEAIDYPILNEQMTPELTDSGAP
jgi:D-alanyl-D-alanine dipeptidase